MVTDPRGSSPGSFWKLNNSQIWAGAIPMSHSLLGFIFNSNRHLVCFLITLKVKRHQIGHHVPRYTACGVHTLFNVHTLFGS